MTARTAFASAWRPAAVCVVALCLACGDDPTASDPVCLEQPTIVAGDSLVGTLQEGDRRFEGAFIDYYAFQVSASARYAIRFSSREIEPLLYRFNAQGEVTSDAFEPVGSPPGEIETTLMLEAFNPGCNLIGASSYADLSGEYSLTVEETEL